MGHSWIIITAAFSVCLAIVGAGILKRDVYIQKRSTSDYRYQNSLPEINNITVCFWANFGADDDDFYDDYLMSISTSESNEAFAIGLKEYLFVTTGPNITVNFTESVSEISHLFREWHNYCFFWTSGVDVKWYVDRTTPGVLELMSSAPIDAYTIQSGGTLVLMNHQDSHGGSLDSSQTMAGKITEFDMWDYVMDDDQIEDLRCRDQGNLASWETLLESGTATIVHQEIPCIDEIPYPGMCEFDVYDQQKNTREYLYADNLPLMSELTICFWINLDAEDDDNREEDYLMSISVSTNFDEFRIGWTNPQSLEVRIGYETLLLNDNNTAENDQLFVGWHKHCFTFKTGGSFSWYADRNVTGQLELIRSLPFSASSIQAGGKLRLMLDQNNHGAGVWADKMTAGKITWFQMWDYELTEEQVKALTCKDANVGNLVTWSSLRQRGSAVWLKESLGDIPYRPPELEDLSSRTVHTDKYQAKAFCKIKGGSLGGVHNLYSVTVSSPARCVLVCTKDTNCWSVNYQHSTKSCTLNDGIDQGNEEDFSTEMGNDFSHFTSRECAD